MNMEPVNHCLQEGISAHVTKITQGITATTVSVFCVELKGKIVQFGFILRL